MSACADDHAIVRTCVEAKEGAAIEARRLLSEMRSAGRTPQIASFNLLLDLYARSNEGMVSEADALLAEMGAVGVSPDVTTFSSVLAVCAKASRASNTPPKISKTVRFTDYQLLHFHEHDHEVISTSQQICRKVVNDVLNEIVERVFFPVVTLDTSFLDWL